MAKFEGSIQEFHLYLGPRIIDLVNSLTRKNRQKGICEHCEKEGKLDSAHVHGKERRTIIESILKRYVVGDQVNCDIREIEKLILQAHKPLSDTFKFLCNTCHREYDRKAQIHSKRLTAHKRKTVIAGSKDFAKLNRIKDWAQKPHQINHKIIKAFLVLEKSGMVQRADLKAFCSKESGSRCYVKYFDNNYASMKTDSGNSHGKIFYEKEGYVHMYPEVRKEVERHFS
jgi:hypothetical protein